VYTIAKDNAALQVQKQLLNSANIFFNKQTQKETDINELNTVLDEKYNELYKEFENNLNLLAKSQDDIIQTVLAIYNRIVKTRGTTENQHDVHSLFPILDLTLYREQYQEFSVIFRTIQSYLTVQQKSNKNKKWKNFFTTGTWKTLRVAWFVCNDNLSDESNEEILSSIAEDIIPQLQQNVNAMISTIKLSYNDPELITILMEYVNNSMISATSPIERHWRYLNIPQIAKGLICITLSFLIEQAKLIEQHKHEELKRSLYELDEWRTNIKEQFLSSKDSFEQGQQFKIDIRKQILSEIIRIYRRIIIYDIHTKITDNSEIEPDKIATNAYNDSIGSNPPDANNILKYVIDINRYYLEIALNKIEISKETIVTNQIHVLERIIFDCVNVAVKTVEEHTCENVQQVYQDIVTNIKKIIPDFKSSQMIGISAEIKDSDRFKENFKQLLLDRTKMYEGIVTCKNIFEREATKSCIDLIKKRLGCQARCPGCGAKCDSTEISHIKHQSSHHLVKAFNGWKLDATKEPSLYLCYEVWLTHGAISDKEKFSSTRDYFLKRNPAWFDNLDFKSKTVDMHKDSEIPLEQRRAWMAVRTAIVKRYESRGMQDFESYDEKLYPAIESVPADFQPTWDYIIS
ncbi:unnamed protein product, partial [Rotaria sp. Silwood2]